MLAHQFIELQHVDLVAGKPEFHFDLVLIQAAQYHCGLTIVQAQGFVLQMQQPVAQGFNPALPATSIATSCDGIVDGCSVSLETFAAGPFQQTVQEGAGIGPTRETVNVAAGE